MERVCTEGRPNGVSVKHWWEKGICSDMGEEHRKYFLRFSYTEDVILTKAPVEEQIICGVDLGINTDAVCTIMRSDGTVLGRKFIDFPSEKDRMYRVLGRIRRFQREHGSAQAKSRWAYQTPNMTGKKIAGFYKICKREPCRYNCFRIPGDKRKDIREKETETASVEKTGYPEAL